MMPGLGGFRNLGLILKLKRHENISSVNNLSFFNFRPVKNESCVPMGVAYSKV